MIENKKRSICRICKKKRYLHKMEHYTSLMTNGFVLDRYWVCKSCLKEALGYLFMVAGVFSQVMMEAKRINKEAEKSGSEEK